MDVSVEELQMLLGREVMENYALRRELAVTKRALEAALKQPKPEEAAR
jgi:hypothetical protein